MRYKGHLTIAPIRHAPSDKSEIVSQLLFGEEVEIVSRGNNDWVEVVCIFDNYKGWMDRKQLKAVDNELTGKTHIFNQLQGLLLSENKWISAGSVLQNETLAIVSEPIDYQDYKQSERVSLLSRAFLNVPYLWGGRSVYGIDCSGFTQVVFKCVGVNLNRDAKDQAVQGDTIDFVDNAQVGDLAFFTKQSTTISHVGIILKDQMIIHASGMVRIDRLDHEGIFNLDTNQYTHQLKTIKRFL